MAEKENKNGSPGNGSPENGMGLFDLIGLAFVDLYKGILVIPSVLRSLRFAVWVLIILAIMGLIGAILPQEHLSHDLAEFGEKYANLFDVIPGDGQLSTGEFIYYGLIVPFDLYDVFRSGLFFTLAVVLGISSVLCAWDRLKIGRVLLSKTRPVVSEKTITGMSSSVEINLDDNAEKSAEKTRKLLKRRGFQIFEEMGDSGTAYIFTRKNSFRHAISAMFHFAFVLVILGLIIGNERVAGYGDHMILGEGDTKLIGQELHRQAEAEAAGQAYEPNEDVLIQLVDYENVYREGYFDGLDEQTGMPIGYHGDPSDYVSHLRIVRPVGDGEYEVIKERMVEMNKPLRYGGVTYYQSAYDYIMHFTITAPGQQPIPAATTLGRPMSIPSLGLNVTVEVWDIAGGKWVAEDGTESELPYVIRLVDYSHQGHGGGAVLLGYITEDTYLELDGTRITLDSIEEYSVIQYRHDPSVPVFYTGSFLLLIGLTIALYFPYRTGRVMIRPDGNKSVLVAGGSWPDFTEILEKNLPGGSSEKG